MSETQAEQDMLAAFKAAYPGLKWSDRGTFAWGLFQHGARYERDRPKSSVANPGEPPVPDAKCRQTPGKPCCRSTGEPDPRLAGLVEYLANAQAEYTSKARSARFYTLKECYRASQHKYARWREGVEELIGMVR